MTAEVARQKGDILSDVMRDLSRGENAAARATLEAEYPFERRKPRKQRKWSQQRLLTIAKRDGFIDRYTRQKLVYPAALAVVTEFLPEEFPAHPSWKIEATHMAYWELFPTLDHITPIASGGDDTDDNIVLTSMLKNSEKSNWTLEELGWKLHAPGDLNQWDGLLSAATKLINRRDDLLENAYIKKWHVAAIKLLQDT